MALSTWNGDLIRNKVVAAAKTGINATLGASVIEAKSNHPGWRNRTGTAEGSVRVTQVAEQDGSRVTGRWGSLGVNYAIWLELKHGSFLRNSADKTYRTLASRIKQAYG